MSKKILKNAIFVKKMLKIMLKFLKKNRYI